MAKPAGRPLGLVLVLDPDPDMRSILQLRLEADGFSVLTTPDGAEALRLLQRLTPDVLVMELMTPGLDGFGLIETVRAHADLAATLIVVVSNRSQDRDVERGFVLGADDYMTKPINPRALSLRIQALLRRGGHAPPDSAAQARHEGGSRAEPETANALLVDVLREIQHHEQRIAALERASASLGNALRRLVDELGPASPRLG